MRTTLDIPENLMDEAMTLARVRTKTECIKLALQGLIRHEKMKRLKAYRGKLDLEVDLESTRAR